jgi:hypothetical protein
LGHTIIGSGGTNVSLVHSNINNWRSGTKIRGNSGCCRSALCSREDDTVILRTQLAPRTGRRSLVVDNHVVVVINVSRNEIFARGGNRSARGR